MDFYQEVLLTLFCVNNACMTAYLIAQRLAAKKKQQQERRRRNRSVWVNPYLMGRAESGRFFKDFEAMVRNPSVFYENFHMSSTNFNILFGMLERYLVPKRLTRPDAIPLKAKLAIVLEYLASGDLQRHIGSTYRVSKQHMGTTVDLVCNAIQQGLAGEVPLWTTDNMLKLAKEFEERWSFPNCVGAVDMKHFALRADSIVLLAICDASSSFTYIDVGAYGSEGDMNAFSNSQLGNDLLTGSLQFPGKSVIDGMRTPYFLVGDNAFPLHEHLMKPYGARKLTREERAFNYRLSRARRCIENAFGLLSTRWPVIQWTLLCPARAQKIVSACCHLHNFLIKRSPQIYGNMTDVVIPETHDTAVAPSGRIRDYPKIIRDHIKQFLNSKDGCVSETS